MIAANAFTSERVLALVFLNAILVGLLVVLTRMVITGRRAVKSPRMRRFRSDSSRVESSILEAIEALKGRVVNNSDSVITFTTGLSRYSWRGQSFEVRITDNGDGSCNVHVGGKRKPSLQVYDFNEAARIIQRLFDLLTARVELVPNAGERTDLPVDRRLRLAPPD